MTHQYDESIALLADAEPNRRRVLGFLFRTTVASVLGMDLLARPAQARETSACTVQYPVKDLNNCPNKRAHPGHVAQSNGCGPAGGGINLVEWALIPNSFLGVDFKPACDAHDICYGTCLRDKSSCDGNFGNSLRAACWAAYGASYSDPSGAHYDFAWDGGVCTSVANLYEHEVASTATGQAAFDAGQKEACECCFSDYVYCACNATCYTDVDVCLNECHASLGCFTGICGPATPGQCPAG